jgi:bifunctional ADP-heptose synthase (sugar kinase/adenylyltransferase)
VAVTGPDALEVAAGIPRKAPRVLVVGDAVLDGWVSGPAHRIGRDGPVPVVEQTDTRRGHRGRARRARRDGRAGRRAR